ncbi:deoxyribose-phosphate aldolase [Halomonas sp. M20]|uniref:deoxyribose-phosphate aldolase n=1 Tax=Halomonas sp. M20 TaxID=2763264 RepID=UPI001D0A7C95|nr:deoxyribose-phosphate aldolase [Halomonas sp. M20]
MSHSSGNELRNAARQALSLLDLTSLNDGDNDATIEALCRRAKTPVGTPAAVCVYPGFVATAKRALSAYGLGDSVNVATVANFPNGDGEVMEVAREVRAAVASGADEVEVVFPYRALMAGNEEQGHDLVDACKSVCAGATLKVILETGELHDPALIRRAGELAIEAGADFLKTSTGKVPVNATLESAEILLSLIRDTAPEVGFKAAGGVRSAEEAQAYLQLATRLMGSDWLTPARFRFGASSLLDDLLVTLGVAIAQDEGDGY